MESFGTFKLRAECYGHSKDVRGIAEAQFCERVILSCSRDETCRVWTEEDKGAYAEKFALRDRKGYVSAVTSLRSTSAYPSGIIFAGGQDKTIRAYSGDLSIGPQFLYALEGHGDTVTALYVDQDTGLLISGSADRTARIWSERECICILSAHLHVIWAVAILSQNEKSTSDVGRLPPVLTGSADKSIILWNNGKPQKTFEGHTDCVRAISQLSLSEFLSASNDATVRRWNLQTGECTMVYDGHENYIYSLSIMPMHKDFFITGAEDGTARIWATQTGECKQTLVFPAQTIWSVEFLSNGDAVCATSDGVIRIFSCEPSRQADHAILETYDQHVAAFVSAAHSKDEIGGFKISDLPGMESLNEPGSKDGQSKMVRNGRIVELYQWSATNQKWEKMGDVLDAAAPTPGKKLYKGKEYDYVFDVDVEEGKPPIKLPYNVEEDPWMAAQRFIHENLLPQVYLEEIVQFITRNAPNAGHNAPAAAYADPFTGGGRYVPGGGVGATALGDSFADPLTGGNRYVPGSVPSASNGIHGVSDPFTGGGRYVPGVTGVNATPVADPAKLDPKRPRGEHMPLTEYVTFATVSADSLLGKLIDFNQKSISSELRLTDEQILAIEDLVKNATKTKVAESHLRAIEKALRWPKDHMVPVLDVFRLAVLCEAANNHFFSSTNAKGCDTVDRLCRFIGNSSDPPVPQFQILVCRAFANALAGGSMGRQLLTGGVCAPVVVPLVVKCLESVKSAAQIAAATALANYAAAYFREAENKELRDRKVETFNVFVDRLKEVNGGDFGFLDSEAVFRLLQALVTFLWGDDLTMAVARSMKLGGVATRLKDATDEEKSKAIARSIERMLNA